MKRFTTLVFLMLAGACQGQMIVADGPAGEEPFSGNAADCPTGAPQSGASCNVAEGQICAFSTPDTLNAGYVLRELCGCWAASSSERRWYCYGGASGPWQCPEAEPESGSSCFGSFGSECEYPERTRCRCSSESGAWNCGEYGRTDIEAPPAAVPGDIAINALTSEERAEWCDWYSTVFLGPGFPEEPNAAVNEDGYTLGTSCHMGSDFPCMGMVPGLSSSDCEANLALSSCAAPIAELSDCLVTVVDSCWPSPHGCARYLEQPGCSGTIVVSSEDFGRSMTPTGAGGTSGTGASGGVPNNGCSVRLR